MADTNAGITLHEVRISHAWDVRSEPSRAAFVEQARAAVGMSLPMQVGATVAEADRAMLRLGPRSWLLLANSGGSELTSVRDSLNDAGGAAFDLSSAYVAWYISGPSAARVLNRACPLDLHPRAFRAGSCAQSLVGHVNAIVYRPRDASAFVVLVARSLAADAWHLLCECAESEGYVVGAPLALRDVLAHGS